MLWGARHAALTLAVIGALVAAVHWPVLRAQALSVDDTSYIADNPLVTKPGWESTGRFFAEVTRPSTFKGYYHPVSMVSLMLNHAAGGRPDDLRVYHLTSLSLHVLNTMLIALILVACFGAWLPAGLAALLFGLHPLTVEPVAWVGEQKALLAAGFSFASILAYVHHVRGRGRGWQITSLVCFALGLLSKPTVVALPLLLVILDAWPLGRFRARTLVEKWPYFLLSAGFAVVTLVSQHGAGGMGATTAAELLRWPLRASFALASHVRHIVWPVDLTCIYPQPAPLALSHPGVLTAVAIVLGVTALVVALARRWRGPAAAWAFFVVGLAPTLSPVKYTWALGFDNYTYLPALGLLALFAAGIAAARARLAGRGPLLGAFLVASVLVVLLAEARGVRATLGPWADTDTLNRHMEALAPDSPVIHLRLGMRLAKQGDPAEAIRHLRRAIELEPDYADAHYNLGTLLAERGQIDEALRHLEMSVAMQPGDPPSHFNLGVALRLAGRLDEAERAFRAALDSRPDYVEALEQLGGVLGTRGRTADAVELFRRGVALRPEEPALRYRLASALTLLGGHRVEAKTQLEASIRLAPNWVPPHNDLAWLLATSPDPALRDPDRALRLAARSLSLAGQSDPRLLDTRAAAEAAAGNYALATRTAAEAAESARRGGAEPLARVIDEHRRSYERRMALIDSSGPGSPPWR